jgi:hypothetical protein
MILPELQSAAYFRGASVFSKFPRFDKMPPEGTNGGGKERKRPTGKFSIQTSNIKESRCDA